MNTAQLRTAARDAANRLDWAEAARLFDAAADAYPMGHGRTTFSALAEGDIASLRQRASDCRIMAAMA